MPHLPSRGNDPAGHVVYSPGSSPAERDRLLCKSGELREHGALLLLARVGVREGWQAVDVGCSPSGWVRTARSSAWTSSRPTWPWHVSDPGTLMLPHLLIMAWGRKPGGLG